MEKALFLFLAATLTWGGGALANIICLEHSPDLCIGFSGGVTPNLRQQLQLKSRQGLVNRNQTSANWTFSEQYENITLYGWNFSIAGGKPNEVVFLGNKSVIANASLKNMTVQIGDLCITPMQCHAEGKPFCDPSYPVAAKPFKVRKGTYLRWRKCAWADNQKFTVNPPCAPGCTVKDQLERSCKPECVTNYCLTTGNYSCSPLVVTQLPTANPTKMPTLSPTPLSKQPTTRPTSTEVPSGSPSKTTEVPSGSPIKKTEVPSGSPLKTGSPTNTEVPSGSPFKTGAPTGARSPSNNPSRSPLTKNPSAQQIESTQSPTNMQCTYEKEYNQTLAALIVFVILFVILAVFVVYLVRERTALVNKLQEEQDRLSRVRLQQQLPPPTAPGFIEKILQEIQPLPTTNPVTPPANLSDPVTPPIPPPTLRMTWDQITPSPSSPPYRRNLRLESDENVVI